MNTIHERLKVFCRDSENEYELIQPDFNENDTEIRIKTCVNNSELQRGWIGDLSYKTKCSRDICNQNIVYDIIAEETYQDVLLVKINNTTMDGYISWEYVFLKK